MCFKARYTLKLLLNSYSLCSEAVSGRWRGPPATPQSFRGWRRHPLTIFEGVSTSPRPRNQTCVYKRKDEQEKVKRYVLCIFIYNMCLKYQKVGVN